MKKDENEDQIVLKFGSIKGGNFANNPEAFKLLYGGEATDIEVVKAFNGKFFLWWDQVYTDKEGAINYLINYTHAS